MATTLLINQTSSWKQ